MRISAAHITDSMLTKRSESAQNSLLTMAIWKAKRFGTRLLSKLKNRLSRIEPCSPSIGVRFRFARVIGAGPDSRAGHLTTKLLQFDDSAKMVHRRIALRFVKAAKLMPRA